MSTFRLDARNSLVIHGVVWVASVTKLAQVEVRSGRVEALAVCSRVLVPLTSRKYTQMVMVHPTTTGKAISALRNGSLLRSTHPRRITKSSAAPMPDSNGV